MCSVFVKVYLEDFDAPLESKPVRVRVGMTERASWTEYAADHERNLVREARLEVSASTQRDGNAARPQNVVDGMVGLGWKPAPEDENPWVRIELARPIRANTILLSHGALNGVLLDRFEIVVHDRDRDRIEAAMVPDSRE